MSTLSQLSLDEALEYIEQSRPRESWRALTRQWRPRDRSAADQLYRLLGGKPLGAGHLLAGRYRLQRELGQGRTGVVWQARDQRTAKVVAVKIFDDILDLELRRRVLAEAQATSAIEDCPSLVRVMDAAPLEFDGPAWLVMECVVEDGEAPCDLARARPRNLDELVTWGRDVAVALAAAHARGVFHRDVKPANAILSQHHRKAKLTDFGAAIHRLHGERAGESVSRTEGSVEFVGTPAFMPPEALAGVPIAALTNEAERRRTLTPIDVFGVGALLYDKLTGEPPRCTAQGGAWRRLRRFEPHSGLRVPRRLRRIIHKALADKPEQRYGSAEALAADLTAWRRAYLTSLDRWWERPLLSPLLFNQRARQIPVLTLLALVVVSVSSAHQISAADEEASRAREQATLADQQRWRTEVDVESARWEVRFASEAREVALSARSAAAADLARLSLERDALQDDNHFLATSADSANKETQTVRSRLGEDLRVMKRLRDRALTRIMSLEVELQSTSAERNALTASLKGLMEAHDAQQRQNEALQSTVNQLSAERSELEKRLVIQAVGNGAPQSVEVPKLEIVR